jgi:hypothetical protein
MCRHLTAHYIGVITPRMIVSQIGTICRSPIYCSLLWLRGLLLFIPAYAGTVLNLVPEINLFFLRQLVLVSAVS